MTTSAARVQTNIGKLWVHCSRGPQFTVFRRFEDGKVEPFRFPNDEAAAIICEELKPFQLAKLTPHDGVWAIADGEYCEAVLDALNSGTAKSTETSTGESSEQVLRSVQTTLRTLYRSIRPFPTAFDQAFAQGLLTRTRRKDSLVDWWSQSRRDFEQSRNHNWTGDRDRVEEKYDPESLEQVTKGVELRYLFPPGQQVNWLDGEMWTVVEHEVCPCGTGGGMDFLISAGTDGDSVPVVTEAKVGRD